MKKTLKIVASLLLVLVTSTFVFAQVSNTNFATAYTLRDDADNFMDVRYYNEVDFSNFFVWFDFYDDAILGFAKKFDELYLGAYYHGTLWSGIWLQPAPVSANLSRSKLNMLNSATSTCIPKEESCAGCTYRKN